MVLSSSSLSLLSSSSSFACSWRRQSVLGLQAPACIIRKEHFRRDAPCRLLDVPVSKVCRRAEAAVAAVLVVIGEYCADCCYCVFDCI